MGVMSCNVPEILANFTINIVFVIMLPIITAYHGFCYQSISSSQLTCSLLLWHIVAYVIMVHHDFYYHGIPWANPIKQPLCTML